MVDISDARRLSREFRNYIVGFLRKAGYIEADAESKVKLLETSKGGRVDFPLNNIKYYAGFDTVPGPQIRFFIERDSSNGLMGKAEESGKTLRDFVEGAFNGVRTNSQLRREFGYLQDRRVDCGDKDYIRTDCRVMKVPEIGEERPLLDDILAILLKPLAKLG